MNAKIIMNTQHRLLPQQESLLRERFGSWEIFSVTAEGITKDQQLTLADELSGVEGAVVFASPVPVLLAKTAALAVGRLLSGLPGAAVFVFANDRREAVESGGKLIHRIHPSGWELVEIV